MADESSKGELTPDELESQNAEALPDREAMSLVWIEPEFGDTGSPAAVDPPAVEQHEPLRGGDQL